MIFNFNYYEKKYGMNIKVIETARKAYDAVKSIQNLNQEENVAALLFAITMIQNDNKNII